MSTGFIRKTMERLSRNHALLTALCIGPLVALAAAYALGFRSPFLWLAAIASCIGAHLLMAATKGKEDKNACH